MWVHAKVRAPALLGCLIFISGCAGPTTPFGAVSVLKSNEKSEVSALSVAPSFVKIRFFPRNQVLHGKSNFVVTIEDPRGISDNARVRMYYNQFDVTDKFLSQAKKTFLNAERTKVQYTIPNFRILPLKVNRIYIGYMGNLNERPAFARYFPPSCSLYEQDKIASSHNIMVPDEIVATINKMAAQEKINPNFVAGLIAQESGFNTKAISWAKAIGLTQITPLGEAQVIRSHNKWPRYPSINRMPLPLLKMRVMRGKINARNEWRLNPQMSIKGGVTYIKYLHEYWHQPDNLRTLLSYQSDYNTALSEAVLASYNSGAARVNVAMQRHGARWLADAPELKEARLYVQHVNSYCAYFSHTEEE